MSKLKRRPKPVIILDLLMRGHKIRKGRFSYQLSNDNELCVVSNRYDSKLLQPTRFGLEDFIELCNSFSKSEIAKAITENALS